AVREALGSDEGVTLQAVPGMPGRVLVQVARTGDADLVVLATRRGHAPSRLLGAGSQHVLRNAPCPLLVVPQPGKEPYATGAAPRRGCWRTRECSRESSARSSRSVARR